MFQLKYFGPLSVGQNSGFTIDYTAQTSIALGAQNAFSYNGLAAGEALAALLVADYFLPVVSRFELGDFVMVSATDGNALLYVSDISYPNNGGNLAAITLSLANAGAGVGTVTQINTGTGLTGGPITGAGTISLASPVSPANGGTGLNNSTFTISVGANSTINQNVSTSGSPSFVNVNAGASGTQGIVSSFPSTAGKGHLALAGVANAANFTTTISNSSMGQPATVSIPDPGTTTANFLLDTGAANILTEKQVVGLNDILLATGGTWTMTRLAEADYGLVHSVADDTSVLSFDITPMLQVAASKGFRLNGIDVMYSITTLALDAHTITLDSVRYGDNVANTVASIPLTGSLETATQANPYATFLSVTTPDFFNPGLPSRIGKYVVELTVDAAATSAYTLYGLNLEFSQTIA